MQAEERTGQRHQGEANLRSSQKLREDSATSMNFDSPVLVSTLELPGPQPESLTLALSPGERLCSPGGRRGSGTFKGFGS